MDEQYIRAIRDIEKDEGLKFPINIVLDMANKKWEFNHNNWGCASHFHCATGDVYWHYGVYNINGSFTPYEFYYKYMPRPAKFNIDDYGTLGFAQSSSRAESELCSDSELKYMNKTRVDAIRECKWMWHYGSENQGCIDYYAVYKDPQEQNPFIIQIFENEDVWSIESWFDKYPRDKDINTKRRSLWHGGEEVEYTEWYHPERYGI